MCARVVFSSGCSLRAYTYGFWVQFEAWKKGPYTAHLTTLVPKTIPGMVLEPESLNGQRMDPMGWEKTQGYIRLSSRKVHAQSTAPTACLSAKI